MTIVLEGDLRVETTARRKEAVDIEWVVTWALGRSGRLPWDRTRDRDLAFDNGLTAKPRRRPPGSWVLAEACAGLRISNGRALPAPRDPGPDALRVLAAIRRLDPKSASLVLACGRGGIRPDWMPGIEPRQVEKRRSHRKCRRGQSRTKLVWEPCHPEEIRKARDTYTRWHAALRTLALTLAGTLDAYEINGFAAMAAPWGMAAKKTG